ncbi:MAG: glycoside hydrolase family 97 protein [Rhodothermaceae bacterium]
MKKSYIIIIAILLFGYLQAGEKVVKSPDNKLKVVISYDKELKYSIFLKEKLLVKPSVISIETDGKSLSENLDLLSSKIERVDENIYPAVAEKQSVIRDNYSELILEFTENYSVIFRVYNDAVAFRHSINFENEVLITDEKFNINFTDDHKVYFPEEQSMFTHQEREYLHLNLSEITKERFSSIPLLVDMKTGPKIAITESDLEDYAGFYLSGSEKSDNSLKAIFPYYPAKENLTTDRDLKVVERESFIARTSGKRNFPWRIFAIADEDKNLLNNQIVYKLSSPCEIETDWIKPGKVAWDWWNSWNLIGVDFRAGINTATYKYFIDFAAQNNIEYIILDEGWYKLGDLLSLNPDVDMEELVSYAKEKNVGLILWVVWKTLDDQFEQAFDQFEKWKVAGLKIDFMQRDDQKVVNFYHKIAKEAAERKMLIDFHGSYKPAGLRRKYPNVLTREGVRGLEWSKWSDKTDPEMALTIPFIRMLAGPMDYTPGAMNNATKTHFRDLLHKPMSQGTRCHQMAMYVVYESPLQMLADSPSNYLREKECLNFIAKVPVVWERTIILNAKVSDYILLARKKNNEWFVGAMTDWSERDLKVDFSFLPEGNFEIEIFKDGINADRNANDYKRVKTKITKKNSMKIHLAPGGGWVARIRKMNDRG